jgi:hypothetical protein
MTDEHNAQVEPNVRVTDEMVRAAQNAYEQDYEYAINDDDMRAAIEAALSAIDLDKVRRETWEAAALWHEDCAAEYELCGYESNHHETMGREHRRFAAEFRRRASRAAVSRGKDG